MTFRKSCGSSQSDSHQETWFSFPGNGKREGTWCNTRVFFPGETLYARTQRNTLPLSMYDGASVSEILINVKSIGLARGFVHNLRGAALSSHPLKGDGSSRAELINSYANFQFASKQTHLLTCQQYGGEARGIALAPFAGCCATAPITTVLRSRGIQRIGLGILGPELVPIVAGRR